MRAPDRDGPLVAIARAVHAAMRFGTRARRYVYGSATAGRFGGHGRDFVFDPDGTYTYESIHVGDNVDLGLRPTIMAGRSLVRIGDNVMFGPEVTIRGGNHRVDVVGTPMIAVVKDPGDDRFDRGVTIGDDVWVGTRAVILHGVTIGRGAVVGAGAVVTRAVPPYTIVAGVPARPVRLRWTVDVIAEHERRLYPPDQRLPADVLARLGELAVAPDGGRRKSATAGTQPR
jgi:acetyltransferase-like isoleucine patch superfamily enzyme